MSTAIREIFKSLQLNHPYQTRLSNTSYILTGANRVFFKSYVYDCISVWNQIPIDIRNSKSLNLFSDNYKTYLINADSLAYSNTRSRFSYDY